MPHLKHSWSASIKSGTLMPSRDCYATFSKVSNMPVNVYVKHKGLLCSSYDKWIPYVPMHRSPKLSNDCILFVQTERWQHSPNESHSSKCTYCEQAYWTNQCQKRWLLQQHYQTTQTCKWNVNMIAIWQLLLLLVCMHSYTEWYCAQKDNVSNFRSRLDETYASHDKWCVHLNILLEFLFCILEAYYEWNVQHTTTQAIIYWMKQATHIPIQQHCERV